MEDLETVEFADVCDAIAEDHHLTRCVQVCFTGTEEDQAEQHGRGTIDEVLEDEDCGETGDVLEEADREADLLEQIPLLVNQSPTMNVQHPIFAFLGELELHSGEYIGICDIYREKHSCRGFVLPKFHKTMLTPPRPIDVRNATKQSRDFKHTSCHHLDHVRSITKWESTCSILWTQSACFSRSWMLCVWEPLTIKHGL